MKFVQSIAVALAAGSALASPASARWVRAESQHFVVYGELSEPAAKTYAQRLERFDSLLRMIVGGAKSEDTPSGKVVVYDLPSLSAVRRLAGRDNIGGFYVGDAQEFHAVVPRSMPAEYQVSSEEILFHEYTHHMTLNTSSATYPSWLTEGLAEFFGTALERPDGSILVGSAPEERGWTLGSSQNQMSVQELLDLDRHKVDDIDMAHKYARGWLLVHYLMMNKGRAGQLDRYMALVRGGIDSVAAGRQAFGDLGKLNNEIDAYMKVRFPGFVIPGDKLTTGEVSTRPLTSCEEGMILFRIHSAIGVDDKTAPTLVGPARAAAANCANDPFVQRALAEIEFDAKNNDQSMAAADRALAIDSRNVMAMVYKGRVYARKGQWADARQWFVRANKTDPNHPLPFVLYYDSFAQANQKPTDAAVNGLLRAVVLAPQDASVRMRAGREMLAEGDLKTARLVLAPVAFDPDGNPDNPARKIVEKLDKGASAKDLLADADKAKWNEVGKF